MRHILLLSSLALTLQLHAANITTLLNTLEHRPEYQLDSLLSQKSALQEEAIGDKLLPKIDLFGGYESYSSPNGLVPVPPNTLIGMVKNQKVGQPFSKHIFREGVTFTWPLFVKSVYTLKEKAKLLHLAAKEKQRLNLIQREAVIVGAVAQLRYLESLKGALHAKRRSIMQTQRTTKLKVKEGRAPESALIVLNGHINTLDMTINTIDQNINTLLSKIETLTGKHLKHSVPMRIARRVKKGGIFALKPLSYRLKASKKGMKAAREAYYPTLSTKGNYTFSQADAYNNGEAMHEKFGMAGLYLSMPLYDASKSTVSQQAKIDYMQAQNTLAQTEHTLKVQAQQLQAEIKLFNRSLHLAQKSINDQRKLLKIAKVSLENETITQEEYLRYEDALANAKAEYYKAQAKKYQDIAQLAVIYGNDLRRIVK